MPHFQTGTATSYRTLLTDLRDFATSGKVATASANAGGSGYTLGDILTVSGGTFFVAATVEVTGVSAGAVTAIEIRQSGGYTANPSTPNTPTGGTGTGCTLDLTFASAPWNVNRDEVGNHQTDERELLLQGVGSGSDQIFVGIRSYSEAGGARNWSLAGFSGFNAGQSWEAQHGKSPGRFDSTAGGAFVPLRDGTIENYWFNVNGTRIIMVAEISGAYSSCYLGFLNTFASATEFPYPMLILGSTSKHDQVFSDTEISYSGIADPIRHDDDGGARGGDVGPGFFRAADGVWTSIYNGEINSGGSRVVSTDCIVMPSGDNVNASGAENQWYSQAFDGFDDFIPAAGNPGTPSRAWRPTPNSGGDIYPTWPCTIALQDSAIGRAFIGEIDDVRWLPALIGPVVAKDTMLGDTHTVFQNGSRSEPWALFLMRTRA